MSKIAIQNQIEAIIAIVEEYRELKTSDSDLLADAEAGIQTLIWCRDHKEAIHFGSLLSKDKRRIEVEEAFPGAQVVDIRRIDL